MLQDATVAHASLAAGSAYYVFGVLAACSRPQELPPNRSRFGGYATGQSWGFYVCPQLERQICRAAQNQQGELFLLPLCVMSPRHPLLVAATGTSAHAEGIMFSVAMSFLCCSAQSFIAQLGFTLIKTAIFYQSAPSQKVAPYGHWAVFTKVAGKPVLSAQRARLVMTSWVPQPIHQKSDLLFSVLTKARL